MIDDYAFAALKLRSTERRSAIDLLLKQIDNLESELHRSAADLDRSTNCRQDVDTVIRSVIKLTEIVRHLAFEMQLESDKAEGDRKLHRLEIENMLLRHELGRPSSERSRRGD